MELESVEYAYHSIKMMELLLVICLLISEARLVDILRYADLQTYMKSQSQ